MSSGNWSASWAWDGICVELMREKESEGLLEVWVRSPLSGAITFL